MCVCVCVHVVCSAADCRNPVRISFDKTEAHGQTVNSVDKADECSSLLTVSLYFACGLFVFCSLLLFAQLMILSFS